MSRINYLNMRIKMFISSYFPLYVILLFINMEIYNSVDKLIKIFKFENKKESIFIITLILFIIISLKSVIDLKRTRGIETHKFSNIENSDDVIISYIMTYIIPLLSSDFLTTRTLIVNITLFILIGFMYIRLNLLYLNPLWLIFGYFMYKADNGLIIVSNIPYSDIKQLEGEWLKGSLISDKIYLIQKNDNEI